MAKNSNSQHFEVKHVKKGMQNLARAINYLTDYQSSAGIHNDKGTRKVISSTKSFKAQQRKNKALINKMVGGLFGGSGKTASGGSGKTASGGSGKTASGGSKDKIRKTRGPNKHKRINIATLAHLLEQTVGWTQKKTVMFDNGSVITKGSHILRQGRIFISLYDATTKKLWNHLRKKVRKLILAFINSKTKKTKSSSRALMLNIAKIFSNRQRDRILKHETAKNKSLTEDLKGENFPLYDSGALLNSIDGKVSRNTKPFKGASNMEFLLNFNQKWEK